MGERGLDVENGDGSPAPAPAVKKKAVAEYSFKKGILVAIFSGIMSAGMSFGLQGGAPLEQLDTPPSRVGTSLRDVLGFFPS